MIQKQAYADITNIAHGEQNAMNKQAAFPKLPFAITRTAAKDAGSFFRAPKPTFQERVADTAAKILPVAGLSMGMYAVPAAISGLANVIRKSNLDADIENSWSEVASDPDIKEYTRQGRGDEIRSKFEVLKTFAPNIAANPLVAKTYVKAALEQPDALHPQTLKPIIDMQSAVDNQRATRDTLLGAYPGLIKTVPSLMDL